MSTEQEYRDLIKRIAKIDRKAALWLIKKAPFYNLKREIILGPNHRLAGIMLWSATPQGINYWLEISKQLGE